jgi:uncharacterized protein YndB with AHSA1/START domain
MSELKRTVWIQARRETVFAFFTDSARWAAWWGAGSAIDARVGGAMVIRYPNGVEVAGEVQAVEPPGRMVFTYGYRSGQPIGVGESLVTLELTEEAGGTRVHLRHEFAEASVRDAHVQGWRFQLSLFANAVADEVMANAEALADDWFAAWAEADDEARRAILAAICAEGIVFRDRYSALESIAEISLHAGAAQKFMPGVKLARQGKARRCQGMFLVDWVAAGPDGKAMMTGANVWECDAAGKLIRVTGLVN